MSTDCATRKHQFSRLKLILTSLERLWGKIDRPGKLVLLNIVTIGQFIVQFAVIIARKRSLYDVIVEYPYLFVFANALIDFYVRFSIYLAINNYQLRSNNYVKLTISAYSRLQ